MANYHQPEKVADCCLCKEIETGVFPAEYAAVYGVDKRICFESDNFIVIPSVSPIAVGHTMLLPKQHYTSMMACPKEMKDEALTLINSLYANLSDRFGQLFLFEHGVGRLDDVACGINHAHLHFVPLGGCNYDAIINRIENILGECTDNTLRDFILSNQDKNAYLMYGVTPSDMSLVYSNVIPSQIVRSSFSHVLKHSEWNWRQLNGKDEFVETVSLLRNIFSSKLQMCEA